MQTLKGKVEYIGKGAIVHCYFTAGYLVNPAYAPTMDKAKEILAEELLEMIDELRTGLIHYDFNIVFDEETINPPIISTITKNNKVPIEIYEDEEGIGAGLYFGNSIFIELGDVSEGKEKLLLSIKEQVMEVYNYLQEDLYEWV